MASDNAVLTIKGTLSGTISSDDLTKAVIIPEGTLTGTLSTDENLTTTLSIGPNVNRGLNQEEKLQLARAYEHSQTTHVQHSDIDGAVETTQDYVNNRLTIDYDSLLAFDTNQIVFDTNIDKALAKTAILDSGVLDELILDYTGEENGGEAASTFSMRNVEEDGTEFVKHNFTAGQVLKAVHLNSIESGIENLQELINVINEKIAILENSTVITVNSITVTYTGGNVEVGTSISSLTGITVKANYSDGTSKTVTGYTLSTGTISQGSNTITVTYQGKTATFNVTGISNVVTYTLTIDPTPSDSTVKINGVEQKSITVNSGTTVNWTVSKEGYIAQSGSTTVTKTETLSITLQEQTGGDETDTTATLGNAVLAKMVLGSGSED